MAFTQVERTDTFEIQRQKINALGAAVDLIDPEVNEAIIGDTYVLEHFTRMNQPYDPSLTPFQYQPSADYRFVAGQSGSTSKARSVNQSALAITHGVYDDTSQVWSSLMSQGFAPPGSNDNRALIGETKLALQNVSVAESIPMTVNFGFSRRFYLTDTAAQPDPRLEGGAFFEIQSPATADLLAVPVLRAVVVNDNWPTGAVIFDQIISPGVFGNVTNWQAVSLKIEITNAVVNFYVNGTLATSFVTTNFAAATSDLNNFLRFKSTGDALVPLGGDMRLWIDYISYTIKQ
jgi:hypothetical protein